MTDQTALRAVADAVVQMNNGGNVHDLLDTHYADTCVSAEGVDMPGGREVQGKDAIKGKWAWWEGAHTVHSTTASGPFLHGENQFGVVFDMDVTENASGTRTQMQELAIYTVEDGKIVREEFFY